MYSILLLAILFFGVWYSTSQKKLTKAAALTGCGIAIVIYLATGFLGVTLMTVFFLMASLATQHKANQKRQLHLFEEKEARNSGQVLANAGAALIIAVVMLIRGQNLLLQIMLAASFASAAADTVATEIGNVYGKTFVNVLTLKKDRRGQNGVISLQGSLAGLAAATIISAIFCIPHPSWCAFIAISIAGVLGNLFDSVLGATLEKAGYLSNNQVNFLNTVFAALIAFGVQLLIGS